MKGVLLLATSTALVCVTHGFVPALQERQKQPVRNHRYRSKLVVLYQASYVAPPLPSANGNGAGAPPLPVLCTNDAKIVERWLDEHASKDNILGIDTESIAKPTWFPERKHLPDGPACIQLSTTNSALVVHLSRCGDGSAAYAPEILRTVLADTSIIKVGVGLDDDALELYRWGKQSSDTNHWEIRSRLDIGRLSHTSDRRIGLRQVAAMVVNVDLPKNRRLTMSNWGARKLSKQQVAYAARDAWAAAAAVARLQEIAGHDVFGAEALLEKVLKGERELADMDIRAQHRRAAKQELKAIKEQEELGEETDTFFESKDVLYKIMKEMRPDQPPFFNSTELGLQF